jgi:hypothetical protein
MNGWRDLAIACGMSQLGLHPIENSDPIADFVTVQEFIDGVMKDERSR